MFEVKKDCYHCIKLRLKNNKCSFHGKIIEDVHLYKCEFWKEDVWMTENDKKEYERIHSLNENK